RSLALFRADAQVEATVTRAIRASLAFDIERHDAPAVIERDAIDIRHERRLDLLATDSHQVILNSLRIVNAFDSQLIVDAEHDHAAACVREGHDFLRDLLGVGQFDFEFEKSVFTAAYQAQ